MSNNTPPGFEDPAFIEELLYSTLDDFTDDEYLLDERPHLSHLNTEDENFEQ